MTSYERDPGSVPAPITDDLTFAIEPPDGPEVIEATQEVLPQTGLEPPIG